MSTGVTDTQGATASSPSPQQTPSPSPSSSPSSPTNEPTTESPTTTPTPTLPATNEDHDKAMYYNLICSLNIRTLRDLLLSWKQPVYGIKHALVARSYMALLDRLDAPGAVFERVRDAFSIPSHKWVAIPPCAYMRDVILKCKEDSKLASSLSRSNARKRKRAAETGKGEGDKGKTESEEEDVSPLKRRQMLLEERLAQQKAYAQIQARVQGPIHCQQTTMQHHELGQHVQQSPSLNHSLHPFQHHPQQQLLQSQQQHNSHHQPQSQSQHQQRVLLRPLPPPPPQDPRCLQPTLTLDTVPDLNNGTPAGAVTEVRLPEQQQPSSEVDNFTSATCRNAQRELGVALVIECKRLSDSIHDEEKSGDPNRELIGIWKTLLGKRMAEMAEYVKTQ